MTSPSKDSVLLPPAEIFVYWVLSFGSHLYSFYQLHRFSKEHEAGLSREYHLENGLIRGFKRDPTDFEWSFWTEWAKKSLLWTLTGHAIVSKLTSTVCPKLRVAALTVYGVGAAVAVLGLRGVLVLLLHLCVSFCVAQLKRPVLSWSCNLLLLATLHIQTLQEYQSDWYKTEEEFYLLLFSVAVCGLRFISFGLDHCWSPLDCGSVLQLCWLFSYTFYHPLFYNGPIVTYRDYVDRMQRPAAETTQAKPGFLLLQSGRLFLWWCIAEFLIHVMYMHAIQSNETYLEILPPWALGGLALALVQFFYVKYLVLFGLSSMLATLDGLTPPTLPRCVSIMYSFTGMWRHFDKGLYRWLIRYIYSPLGGSRRGVLSKIFSSALTFVFVCFWHGGHTYMRYWALMNWVGVMVETGFKSFFCLPCVRAPLERHVSAPTRRRCLAFLSSFSTALLILSNLVFLGGIHVGRIFWKRVFLQGWCDVAPLMLLFLYCFAQVGLDWTSHQP